MNMVCDRIRDEILDSRDERMEYGDSVKGHLEQCEDCRKWERDMADAQRALSMLEAPPLPGDFAAKLAARAVEEHQQGWLPRSKRALSSFMDRAASLLLGPARVPRFSLRAALLWSAVLASVAAMASVTMIYCEQVYMKHWLTGSRSLTSMQVLKNTCWMPFVNADMNGRQIQTLMGGAAVLSMIAIALVAFRVLNLRAFFSAVWKRRRIPPMAVILPLLGIVITAVVMNYSMVFLQILFDYNNTPRFTDLIGPYFLSNSPLPLPLAMLINYVNPLISPGLGWVLTIAAFLVLMLCSARSVHSMVRFFYGSIACAALFQAVAAKGVCYAHYGLLSSIWSYGTSGIISLKALSFSALITAAFSAAAFALVLSLLSFNEGVSVKEMQRKRMMPSAAVLLISSAVVAALISPVAGDVMRIRTELSKDMDYASRFLSSANRVEESSTVVAFTSDCVKAPDRYMKGRIKSYNIPSFLRDEKRYGEMEAAMSSGSTPKSYRAISYLVSADLARWDQRSYIAHCFGWLETHGRESLWMKYSYAETPFYNGMSRDEIDRYLTRITDPSKFFLGEDVKAGLASVYASLGRKPGFSVKGGSDTSAVRKRNTFFSGPLDGTVKGSLVVNGMPASGVDVRLYTPYNYYYYDSSLRCPSEDDFLYQLDLSLWNEYKTMARNPFTGYMHGFNNTFPLITAKTDRSGRFEFRNLAEGSYYLIARLPGVVTAVTQKTPVGIIKLTSSKKTADLGAVKLDLEGVK
jgi:hypothetical protein